MTNVSGSDVDVMSDLNKRANKIYVVGQDAEGIQRSITYKADAPLKRFQSTDCISRQISTRETYCLKSLGQEKQCDTGRQSVAGSSVLGHRDYGALLLHRFGRKGYKITFQVVGLLWDFRYVY